MQVSKLPIFFSHVSDALFNTPDEVRRLFHGRGRVYPDLSR